MSLCQRRFIGYSTSKIRTRLLSSDTTQPVEEDLHVGNTKERVLDRYKQIGAKSGRQYPEFVKRIAPPLSKLLGITVRAEGMSTIQRVYPVCAMQTEYHRDYYIDACKLPDNYQTWFSVTALHLWMVIVRFRPETHGETYNEILVNTFFEDVEWRMCNLHGVKRGSIATRYIKDFLSQFRGAVMAYDEGLCKSDAILAAALWR
ncbi:3812_t:CDS:2 [Paraglomus brasilianum]|uniref:3812_t:CDS:1 n=1 Tax=Paraglomus brasilianum TaxID=144538 RepID=A0A9N8WJE6_9GLOM|nr:3812_t:CDS:2 [Paraglomus brasilianum]